MIILTFRKTQNALQVPGKKSGSWRHIPAVWTAYRDGVAVADLDRMGSLWMVYKPGTAEYIAEGGRTLSKAKQTVEKLFANC